MSLWSAFSSNVAGMTTKKTGGFFSDVTAGGILQTVGSIFGKTKPPTVIYADQGTPETPETKSKTKSKMNMILIIGAVALVGSVAVVFLKK